MTPAAFCLHMDRGGVVYYSGYTATQAEWKPHNNAISDKEQSMQPMDVWDCVQRLSGYARRHPPRPKRGQSTRRLLRLILENEGVNARTLAEWMDIRPPSLSELLDKLEAQGLARRVRDTADARVIRVRLTEAGRAAAMAGEEEALRTAWNRLLSDAERETLCRLTEKLSGTLEAWPEDKWGIWSPACECRVRQKEEG